MDFGTIFAGIGSAGAIIAIIAGGKLRIVIGFAAFAARRVGRFFDDRSFWADRYGEHQVDSWKNNQEPMSMRDFKASGQVQRR